MVSHEPAAVYPEREDTDLLVPFARAGPGKRVLDLGTGNGRLAVEAALSGSRVVATDLNPHALRRALGRARALTLPLEAVRTDLAAGLGRFDRIVANPPYLPTRIEQRDPDRWTNLALDGGPDGCGPLRRIVEVLPNHLVNGGAAYVLVSTLQDPVVLRRLRRGWAVRVGPVTTVARRSLPGEMLEVWELRADRTADRLRRPASRRSGRPPQGTGGRRRTARRGRAASSPAPARGRTPAPGAASGRRRSRSGS